MKVLPNTVIYFHEVQDQNRFINILESLLKNYHIISINELEEYYYRDGHLKNSCHITFDDGDISFYTNVFPVIKKYKIPVSLYVSPLIALENKNFWFQEIKGYNPLKMAQIIEQVTKVSVKDLSFIKDFLKSLPINVILEIIKVYQKETNTPLSSPRNMNVTQLIELKASGLVEIGAHTLNHPLLINESDEVAEFEISESINLLGNILDTPVSYFVYPNGDYSAREMAILNKKGIKLAFTTERGKLSKEINPLSIPRSGSPIISNLNNNKAYTYSKCLVQLVAGENLYYKCANSWESFVSKVK